MYVVGGLLAVIGWLGCGLTLIGYAVTVAEYRFDTPDLILAANTVIHLGGALSFLLIAGVGHLILGVASLRSLTRQLVAKADKPAVIAMPAPAPEPVVTRRGVIPDTALGPEMYGAVLRDGLNVVIDCDYLDATGRTERRRVTVDALLGHDTPEQIRGHCHRTGTTRTYDLQRIRRVVTADGTTVYETPVDWARSVLASV